jgi:hypothetical protein
MLCLRVAALYRGVRWVTWSLWIGFVVLHGMRSLLAILGSMLMAGE